MSFGSFGKPAASFGGATAPASSPFGQAAQPATGLFGSASSAPAAGTSLFGQQQNQTTNAAAGSSLFGQQQQQPQTSSLFGGQQQATNTAGGLFGQQQTQPQSTGLFGQQSQTQQQGSALPGQQQPGMFGSLGAKPAGGLFGSTATQPSGGMFGGASTANTAQPAGGLFGQQQAPQQSSLFGQQQAPQQSSLFGQQSAAQPAAGGLFGQQSTAAPAGGLFAQQSMMQPAGGLLGQQNSTLGQQQQGSSLFNKPAPAQSQSSGIGKTRLADLPENVQKVIELLDSGIKDQKQIGASIDTSHIGRAIWQTSADVKAAGDEQAALAHGLYSLRASLELLATRVNEQATDLQKLLETWEAAKPLERRNGNIRPIAHRDVPQDLFFRVAKALEERVGRYRRNIMLLHRAIIGLSRDDEALSPSVVVQTIQNNQATIISLAARLDELQLRMDALRNEFTDDYREKTHSMRDPFEVAREERVVSLLQV
ncbi:hypothetical protein CspeluHIS016_0302240 [Cutaneotrichosporon spelunceum]|uniref:Nucleoporin Nup54 alpha-helical domain-containing protein n=1 Tax=Cutaneotrichosporon spelunceum TaxID=1672016 RepID=A0AAD3TT95_9TREE|nr:hypothetical protein CspeluHIS016_0302240 [Cutaneotrichosporon spelunceum]